MIKKVMDNIDKRLTYSVLNKKCKEALAKKEYETVIMYSYAMIEDRLLSMLHYLYIVNRNEDRLLPVDYIDNIIRPLLKYNLDADKNKIYKINNITTKIKLIRIFNILNAKHSNYINDGYKIIKKNIDLYEFGKYFEKLNKWIKIRNEIVHSSFNKNIDDLNNNIEKIAYEGYELAKKVSKYTNSIKDSCTQISLRTKWEGIEKVFRNLYKEECNANSLTTVDYLTEYDVTFPTFFDYAGDPATELDDLKRIIFNENFFESKNDLNIIIKDKLLKTETAYADYIMSINALLNQGYRLNINRDQFKKYIELDNYFNINNTKKFEIIREQLFNNYWGGDSELIKYLLNYINKKYMDDISNLKISEVLELINKDEFNIIGLSDKQLENPKIKSYLNELVEDVKCKYAVIYDFIIIMLNKTDTMSKEIIDEDPFADYYGPDSIPYDLDFKDHIDDNAINPFDYEEYGEINYKDFESIKFWLDSMVYDEQDVDVILKDIPKEIYDNPSKLAELCEIVSIKKLNKHINPLFYSNKEIIYKLASVLSQPYVEFMYNHIDDILKQNREFLLGLVKIDDNYFKFLDNKFRKDKDFILDIYNFSDDNTSIKNIPTKIVIKVSEALFPYLDDTLKNDEDVIMAAVNYRFWEVEYIPEKYKKKKKIIEKALEKDVRAYQYLYEYIDDKEYIKQLYKKYHFDMKYLPDDIKKII